LKIELPTDVSSDDADALREYLETQLVETKGLTAEVDLENPSRSIGGFDPALIVSLIATGAGVAANLGVIIKTIKEAKSLSSDKGRDAKQELTPTQRLLLSLDPAKIVVKVDGKDIPIAELVPEDDS
jgi:hypothetical protein